MKNKTTTTIFRNKITGLFFDGKSFEAKSMEDAARDVNPAAVRYTFDNVETLNVEVTSKRFPGTRKQPGGRQYFFRILTTA